MDVSTSEIFTYHSINKTQNIEKKNKKEKIGGKIKLQKTKRKIGAENVT
jgi:hypothetical protein